ncbi:hypothetical protein HPP92_007642 [Vanilla planifolia]|uniref:Protein kinase domain-containing protein n=1 Tax=Vanilla planifolia TaxID=51239 RepID=A0A835V7W6_VANPL|nr:hypothetical protein HPP92_007642 [Vanilla planifolia]
MKRIQLAFFACILFCASGLAGAQQAYWRKSTCRRWDKTPPPSSYLYSCNGLSKSCKAYVVFISQPSYNTVASISNLLFSEPREVARINGGVLGSHLFPIGEDVIVPVKCSCSGRYYQANASFIDTGNDTYYLIAYDTYQGLASCSALLDQNPYDPLLLTKGMVMSVPIRCACPTSNQSADGVKFLLTASVANGRKGLPGLCKSFNASVRQTIYANSFVENDPYLSKSTTVLLPLPTEPQRSEPMFRPLAKQAPPAVVFYFGIALGLAGFLLISAVLLIILWWHRRKENSVSFQGNNVIPKEVLAEMVGVKPITQAYEFEELKAATRDFSPEYKVGDSVYRAVVRGKKLVVKRTIRDVSVEVKMLNKLNHFNIISICGLAINEEGSFLIYEYMENGSLKDWLHDARFLEQRSWARRVQIAIDVANGLDYIHNFADRRYVHNDINSCNILLNHKLRAKIANFSSAGWAGRRGRGFSTAGNVVGSPGYLAPEYSESGLISPKIDVFAFGVVILELTTGREAVIEEQGKERLLSEAVASMATGADAGVGLIGFVCSSVREASPMELVMEMAKLGLACLRHEPERRPSMNDVVSFLSRIQNETRIWESGTSKTV